MTDSPLNPFQAPISTAEPNVSAGDFTIERALSDGWSATMRNFPLWLGVGAVALLLIGVSAITIIGYFLVVPVVSYGGIKFLLKMLDGEAEFNDLFAGFSKYGSVLGRMLLLTLTVVLVVLLSESVMLIGSALDSGVLQAVGSLIYLASVFFVVLPLSFSYFFAVDRDMPAIEALSASWRITRGKLGKVVLLTLVAGLIGVLGLLALGIGIFFSMTMSYVMFASAYRQMVGPAPAAEAPAAS